MAPSSFSKLAFLALLASLCMTLWFAPKAHACSCLVQEPREALAASTTVFEGRVIRIARKTAEGQEQLDVKFTVLKAWKGLEAEKTVSVTTSADGSMCGYSFAQNGRYLVYALQNGDRLETSLCTRTRELSQAQADLEAFESDGKDSPITAAKSLGDPTKARPPEKPAATSATAPAQVTPPSESKTPEAAAAPPSAPPPARETPEPAAATPAAEPAAESCSVVVNAQSNVSWWLLALVALALQRRGRMRGPCRF